MEPHTTQLNKIGTSSLAMIPIVAQSAGQLQWNQRLENHPPYPHEPESIRAVRGTVAWSKVKKANTIIVNNENMPPA